MVGFSLLIFTIHGLDVTFSIQKVTTVSSRFIHNPALCLHHNRWLTVKPNKKKKTHRKEKKRRLINSHRDTFCRPVNRVASLRHFLPTTTNGKLRSSRIRPLFYRTSSPSSSSRRRRRRRRHWGRDPDGEYGIYQHQQSGSC